MAKSKKKVYYGPRKGSNYQERQKEKVATMMSIAMECGEQRVIDFLTCVLHDSNIMGKDTFGPDRIDKIIYAIKERDIYYNAAFNSDEVEADYKQEELDSEIREARGKNGMTPFRDRYPMIKQLGYDKPRKEWKDG